MLNLINETFTGKAASETFRAWLKGYKIGADRAGFSYIDISLPFDAKRSLMSNSIETVNSTNTSVLFSETK